MSGRILSLQALRFLAAIGVVHAHAMSVADSFARARAPVWHQAGTIGVDLFFVISGFIIARIAFIDRSPTAAAFLRGRWLRVAPIYWLATLAWMTVDRTPVAAPNLVATVFFWPGTGAAPALPILPYGWTLCFEMLFYLAAAAVLASPGRGRAVAVLIAAWLACVALRYGGAHGAALSFLGNPIVGEFLAGVAIAHLRVRRPALGALVLVAAAAMIWSAAGVPRINDGHFTFDASLSAQRLWRFGLPAAGVVFAVLQFEPWFQGRAGRALAYLGDTSYVLYLTHPLAFTLLWALARSVRLDGWAIVTLGIVLAAAAAVAAHEWVEKPLMRRLRPSAARLALKPA